MNQLDFRKSPKQEGTIIQPDFKIQGYTVEVNPSRGDYRLEIGCQKMTINSKNVQQLLDELNGVQQGEKEVQLILGKKQVKDITTITNIPKYLESSDAFLISTTKKVYPKELYTLLNHKYTPDGEYFTRNKNTGAGTSKSGYSITANEVQSVIFIVEKLKAVLIPEGIVEAPAIVEPAPAVPDSILPETNA